ncbi:hypothetical protein MTP99_003060 [Tenebrio molitor]|nr:hypothetical protein MTP99_003060 [Tenebrio molitor]
MANFIVENHGHLLENLNAHQWLNRNRYQLYAQSIVNMGGAIQNCWGFIDGTVRPICRPSNNQDEYYSGHKRLHCVKYQSVLTPDGLIVNLKGAFPGRRHDAGIFRETNLYEELEQNVLFPNGEHYVLYGDQAYGALYYRKVDPGGSGKGLFWCPSPQGEDERVYEKNADGDDDGKVVRRDWYWNQGPVPGKSALFPTRPPSAHK